MRSIRRSLILNVSALLALALGAICGLVYHTSWRGLEARQAAAQQLIHFQFNDQRDEALLTEAETLASLAHSQVEPERFRQLAFTPLGLLSAAASPHAHLQIPLWLAESGRNAYRLHVLLATEIRVSEEVLNRDPGAAAHEYLQINSEWGNIWRSRSLGGHSLDFDVSVGEGRPRYRRFDDVEPVPGVLARRVVLKTQLTRFRLLFGPKPGPRLDGRATAQALAASGLSLPHEPPHPEPHRGGPPLAVPGSTRAVEHRHDSHSVVERSLPYIYVQCAWSNDPAHPAIAELIDRRDRQLASLEDETQATLRDLRSRLLWIGLITLGVMLVGGWLLIGLGLAPLARLSVAVGSVSEKDFRLPIERAELPREALPLAERLNQTLSALGRAFDREKRAAADISHELRTPVGALLTTLEVALRKPRSAEAYRETLEDCRGIGKQLSRLVERVLALARLDAGSDAVHVEQVQVRQVIEGCAAIAKPLAEAQGLNFRVRAGGPEEVRTDPDKLREVVMNLVHNAIEYNRPGGGVEVSVRSRDSGGVVLEVRDTGVGIPAEIREKIFERFFRGDPSRNGTGVHAGLGLAIVREYVDRLGGKLTLDSEVGVGSLFRVELPNLS